MSVQVKDIPIGDKRPLVLIAGTCAIESEALAMRVAEFLKEACGRCGMPLIYKSSFEKANRSSGDAYSGLGMEAGLEILAKVRDAHELPVLTDVHEYTPVDEVAEVADVLQTPAFLCRQTEFIRRVAQAGKPVNLKKGQFLSPAEMSNVVAKAREAGNDDLLVCERGFAFGYNNLVADMRSLVVMRETACPVVFDATHSVQLPGGAGDASGGQREFAPVLARAAVAVGVDAVFIETHPEPEKALSDGATSLPLDTMPGLIAELKRIDDTIKHAT